MRHQSKTCESGRIRAGGGQNARLDFARQASAISTRTASSILPTARATWSSRAAGTRVSRTVVFDVPDEMGEATSARQMLRRRQWSKGIGAFFPSPLVGEGAFAEREGGW